MGGFDGSRRALAALKDMTSQLIGRFVGAAIAATRAEHGDGELTRYAARLVVPVATAAEILALKGLAATYVMAPREHEPLYLRQRELIAELVDRALRACPGRPRAAVRRGLAGRGRRRRPAAGRGGPGRLAHGRLGSGVARHGCSARVAGTR